MKKISAALAQPKTQRKGGDASAVAKATELQRRAYLRSRGVESDSVQLSFLFPDMVGRLSEERFLPNDTARCALFSARNRRVPRRTYMHEPLFHLHKDVQVIYTGQELRAEDDELIWMQILFHAKTVPLGDPFVVHLSQLIDDLDWDRTGRNYDRLRESFSRLNATELLFFNSKAFGASGAISMVDRYLMLNGEDGKPTQYQFWIDKSIIVLFAGNTFTAHSWITYRKLSPVARRLADYLESHRVPLPLTLDNFKQMCASQDTQIKSFRETVRRAINELKSLKIVEEILLVKDVLHFKRFEAVANG